MPLGPNITVDVYVCYGVERGMKFPNWMLMIRSMTFCIQHAIPLRG